MNKRNKLTNWQKFSLDILNIIRMKKKIEQIIAKWRHRNYSNEWIANEIIETIKNKKNYCTCTQQDGTYISNNIETCIDCGLPVNNRV